jgi:hypothetical protein
MKTIVYIGSLPDGFIGGHGINFARNKPVQVPDELAAELLARAEDWAEEKKTASHKKKEN